jgi:hypothetical protein
MKKFIFLLLIFFSPIIYAEEIKLSCVINLQTTYDNGSSETHRYNEIFTVTDKGKFKSIVPTSSNFQSVTVFDNRVLDGSKLSRWDIVEGKKTGHGNSLTTITIDRNTGKIWYKNIVTFLQRDSWVQKGEGDCEKIDVSKKKF